IGWPPASPALQRLIWEKLPLFAMSAASSALTFLAQRSYGSVITMERLPLSMRLGNAAISYISYLAKFFWPAKLGVFYPYSPPQAAAVFGALLALIALTAACLLTIGRRPYLAVGWLWYLGALVPVIGVVQVGVQSRADRYTYLPLVGISVALAWGAA